MTSPWSRTTFADVGCNGQAELVRPATDGLIRDIDSAFGEHLFDITQARHETEIEPHSGTGSHRAETGRLNEGVSSSF